MAHQGGIDHVDPRHALVQRILEDRGASGKAFFEHQVFFAELLLQQAGPAFIFIETVTVVSAVRRVGAVAVGVGISKTNDMFSHNDSSKF